MSPWASFGQDSTTRSISRYPTKPAQPCQRHFPLILFDFRVQDPAVLSPGVTTKEASHMALLRSTSVEKGVPEADAPLVAVGMEIWFVRERGG